MFKTNQTKQRLNQLIELISNQEAKLNRLKALRELAKEQTNINVELNNELKTVNNSVSEKDAELKQALNKVDNLNRQLSNYRRTRTYRNSKNVTACKQTSCNHDSNIEEKLFEEPIDSTNDSDNQIKKIDAFDTNINGHTSPIIDDTNTDDTNTDDTNTDDTNTEESSPNELSSSSRSPEISPSTPHTNAKLENEDISTRSDSQNVHSEALISDKQDLTKPNLTDPLDQDDSQVKSTIETSNQITKLPTTHFIQNHSSPSINKYTNARQKLIGGELKNNGRRVSFDPLSLLLDAAYVGELDLVIQTSKQVSDLNASYDECVTALHNAVVAGHNDIAKYLIEAGCDINVQDGDSWTPLHCAASVNNLPLVKFLIEKGALIYATTASDNSTPAMKCEQTEQGFEDCYKYLMYIQNNLGIMNNGVVYALYDYEAQEEDELSFVTGEELIVLRRDDSQEQEWWWAQKRIQQPSDTVVDIKEGYIPRNLLGLYPRVKAQKSTSDTTPTVKCEISN